MKILGINFSSRTNGNCNKCLQFCMNIYKTKGYETEIINLVDHKVESCGNCSYNCFHDDCVKTDNLCEIYSKMSESDFVIFATPTYCGHLSSLYFIFSERAQGFYNHSVISEDDLMKKISLLIIGNPASGGDMALHEALYNFSNRSYSPEVLLLSSREYSRRSILGDFVEEEDICNRLRRFSNKIIDNKILI